MLPRQPGLAMRPTKAAVRPAYSDGREEPQLPCAIAEV
jgi:hypothetical protein